MVTFFFLEITAALLVKIYSRSRINVRKEDFTNGRRVCKLLINNYYEDIVDSQNTSSTSTSNVKQLTNMVQVVMLMVTFLSGLKLNTCQRMNSGGQPTTIKLCNFTIWAIPCNYGHDSKK